MFQLSPICHLYLFYEPESSEVFTCCILSYLFSFFQSGLVFSVCVHVCNCGCVLDSFSVLAVL